MPRVTASPGPPSAPSEPECAPISLAVAGMEMLASIALFHCCTWIIGPRIEMPLTALAYIGILALCGLYILLRPSPGTATPLLLSLPKPCCRGIMIFPAITGVGLAALRLFRLEADPNWLKLAVDASKYLALAAVQVVWLYLFLLPRLRLLATAFRRKSSGLEDISIGLSLALIFAFNHLPNFPLMICGGGITLVWTWAYLRSPNPYLLSLSHAVLASGFLHLLDKSTRVGPGYWHSGYHAFNKSLRLITHWISGVF